MPELLTYTPSLTDEERDELDGIVADLLLPTFTPRERLIARTAVRLVLKARPVTGAGTWQPPTCATCRHHNVERPNCERGIGRPNYIDPDRRVDAYSFGCTLHEPAPTTPTTE